jgi:hypothetical protein
MSLEITPDWYYFKISSLPLFYNYKEDLISLTLPCPIQNIKQFIEVYKLDITYEELTNAIKKLNKKTNNKKNKKKLTEKEVNLDPITDEEKLKEFLTLSEKNRISNVFVEICNYKYGMNLNHQYIQHDDGTISVSVSYRGIKLLEGPIQNTKAEAKNACIYEVIKKLCPTISEELYKNNEIRHNIKYGLFDNVDDENENNNENYDNQDYNQNFEKNDEHENIENQNYNQNFEKNEEYEKIENQDYNQNFENDEYENIENKENIENNNNDIEFQKDIENNFETNENEIKDESEDIDIIDINNERNRKKDDKLKEEENNVDDKFDYKIINYEIKKDTQIDNIFTKKEIIYNEINPIKLNDNEDEINFNENKQIILNDIKPNIFLGSKRINDNETLFNNPKIKETTKVITLEISSSNSDSVSPYDSDSNDSSISGSDSTKSNNSNKKKLKEKNNLICGDEQIVQNYLDSFELKPIQVLSIIIKYFPNEKIKECCYDQKFFLKSKSISAVSDKNREQCANLFLSKIPMDIEKKYNTIIKLVKNKIFKHFFVKDI